MTEQKTDGRKHSRDEIYERVESQGNQIQEIARGQAATDARLTALDAAVASGFSNLTSEIKQIANKVNKPEPAPNYIGWLGAALGIMALFGSYSFLVTNPLLVQIDRNERHIEVVEQDVKELAEVKAKQKLLIDDMTHSRDFREGAKKIQGQIEELSKRVEDIDNKGSRAWAGGPRND